MKTMLSAFLFALCIPLFGQELTIATRIVGSNGIETTVVDESDRLILAKPKKTSQEQAINAVAKRHGLKEKTKFNKLKWKKYEVPSGKSKAQIVDSLKATGLFEAVQEDKVYRTQDTIPNDPFFGQLWGMTNISAPSAWDLMREAPNVIVAVVDTGIDFNHPDIAGNLWTGPYGEHGYQVVQGVVSPGGTDDHGHGTHCAGTIAGVGNNGIGVAGVAWKTQIMAMKVLHAGSGTSVDIATGIEKLVELKEAGLPIVASNHSYGGGGIDQLMLDAFALLEGADIFAAIAAGNNGGNIDAVDFEPAVFPFNNIISTMASDSGNNKATFSNFGIVRCDISAPGVGVLSCTRNNTYSSWSGTSMAAPHVCGVALTVRARNPNLSAREVRDLILDPGSYDVFAGLSDNNTSARINLNKTLNNPRLFESPFRLNRPPVISSITGYTVVTNQAAISFSASDIDGDSLRSSMVNSSDVFSDTLGGYFKKLIAKNGFSYVVGQTNVQIAANPFAYQLAGGLNATVSDNRGGGDSSATGFEVIKNNGLRRQINIKTWTVKTNDTLGSITWVFDVDDANKSDYSYILTWSYGFSSGSWAGFEPSPNPITSNIGINSNEFSVRVFVLDKYFNYANSEQIIFSATPANYPTCRVLPSTLEGNAPFSTYYDFTNSTGPINLRIVVDFFTGKSSSYQPEAYPWIVTQTYTEPVVKLMSCIALSTVTRNADRVVIPVFSSRFASIGLTNEHPIPQPITNLFAVTNLTATVSNTTTVFLNWTDGSQNESGYVIEGSYKARGNNPQTPYEVIANVSANTQSFSHVPPERKADWFYRVKACAGQICAPNSNVASVRIR
jgi:subtilisin family serine protease